jgi:hypothetical protein
MKSFKKLAIHTAMLGVFALTLNSCFENQAIDPLLDTTLSNCKTVENPLKDYWWLASQVSYSKSSTIHTKIYSAKYANATLYLVETYNKSSLVDAVAYDCNGGVLISYCNLNATDEKSYISGIVGCFPSPCTEDKYMPLKKRLKSITLLFEKSN